jgi:hypothetical protein
MLDSIDFQSDLSYNLINAYRLCRPTAYDFIGYALNSSITSEDLNAKFIGQYKALKEVDNVIYSNAMNFASIFTPFNELKSYYVKPIVDTSLDSDSFKSDFININK